MLLGIYPIIQLVFFAIFCLFLTAMLMRLVFNFSDPNPFGKVGRFSYHLKKRTDKFVYPAARLLANYRSDTRYAPIITILIGAAITYFALRIIYETFYIIEKLSEATKTGNIKAFIGFVLYALLSVLVLFIFIRFISAWFVFTRSTFLAFVQRVTDPILIPVQRLIPPIGMFDISAMLVLILISFLQTIVLRIFVYS